MSAQESLLDQLRVLEGRLFQNENVLSLYLDVKATVVEHLTSLMRTAEDLPAALAELGTWPESAAAQLNAGLASLSDADFKGHATILYDAVKVYAKLLYPLDALLVARPKVDTLLRGMVRRLVALDCIKSKTFLTFDPIKQDFVLREAFRRTLANDCIVVFDTAEASEPVTAPPPPQQVGPAEEDDDIGPDDSASAFAGSMNMAERPAGARSVIGTAPATLTASAAQHEHQSVAPSRIRVAPAADDAATQASHGTRLTQTSTMRKPVNVKRIHITNEERPNMLAQ